MRKVHVTAKTVEEAVAVGLQQLGITRDRAQVVVQVAPTRGFLGFGSRNAEIAITAIDDPVGDAERFLREMFITMHLAVRVQKRVDGRDVTFDLQGDRVGLLIGKHGQTLDSIEYLVTAIGNKHADKRYHFTVDAQGYRERRKQALQYRAEKMAEKALYLRKEISLEPMTAQERKIIHVALQERQDVRTESRGTEPDRAIVIIPMEVHKAVRKPSLRAESKYRQQVR